MWYAKESTLHAINMSGGAPLGLRADRQSFAYVYCITRAAFENFQKRNQPHLLQTEIDMIGCLAVIVLC